MPISLIMKKVRLPLKIKVLNALTTERNTKIQSIRPEVVTLEFHGVRARPRSSEEAIHPVKLRVVFFLRISWYLFRRAVREIAKSHSHKL